MVLGSGLLLILGGFLVYQDIEARHRHLAERELLLVNRLQLQNLRTWREARMTDAQTLMGDVPFSRVVAQWRLADDAGLPDEPTLRALIQGRLRLLREQAGYDAAYLVGADGGLLLTPTGIIPGYLPPAESDALRQAWAQAQPTAVEPRRDLTFAFPFSACWRRSISATNPSPPSGWSWMCGLRCILCSKNGLPPAGRRNPPSW